MVDLSKNTNPFSPSKKMLRFLKKNINIIRNYSDKHIEVPEDKVLDKFNIKKENILITNGTLGAMELILKANKNKHIGLFDPTFWGMKELAKKNGNLIIEKKINVSPEYNINDLNELATKSDILYLCNCNNPTLNYIDIDKLISIIKKNSNCLFIIDETILIFDDKFESKTAMKYANKLKNLVVLISMSKIFGICGLRAGLLIASTSKIEEYKKLQVPFSNNSLSAIFIEKYFPEIFNLNKCKRKIKKNINYLIKNIDTSLINKVIFNSTSFILIELKDFIDYQQLELFLTKNKIKVAAINNKYNTLDKKYLRISAGTKREYKKLIKVLNKYSNK